MLARAQSMGRGMQVGGAAATQMLWAHVLGGFVLQEGVPMIDLFGEQGGVPER